MRKKPVILFVLVFAMVAATAGFLFHIRGNQTLGKPGVRLGNTPLYDVNTNRVAETTVILPSEIPGYTSSSFPITPIEITTLPKDTTFGKRLYWTTNQDPVQVNVVLMGQDRTSLHKPQFCLTGQGWTIDQTEQVNVRMKRPYAYDLPMLKLTASTRRKAENGQSFLIRGVYAYWFVADNKVGVADQRMWSMMKNFLTTGTLERWAYISYFSVCQPGESPEQTFARMSDLIAKSVPEFQLAAGSPLPETTAARRQASVK